MSRARSILLTVALAGASLGGVVAAQAESPGIECTADPASYVTQSLTTGEAVAAAEPVLRFVNLSDSHIIDDEASPVMTANYLESVLDPTLNNQSGQRLQEEYTDEVLNAMIRTIDACGAESDLEFMIATGDLTDNQTLNETRRYIDNLDGVSGADTAYEAHCGYTTHDSRGVPKLGVGPCTEEMQDPFAVPTGKLVGDTQAPVPDPNDPTYQVVPTRSARQIAETGAASVQGGSSNVAPGLPPSLRCTDGEPGCENEALDIPHYAVFGNHDSSVRGTVPMQQPFQAVAAFGRYFFESQREFLNEFFHTQPHPGPVGHGFNHVEPARFNDDDDRNDGYYAFDVPMSDGNQARMVVMNTIFDGVMDPLHQHGATNAASGGLVTGNEVTNPIGLETGVMDSEQFAWLDGQLSAAADAGQPVFVFSHHPDRSFSEYRLGMTANGGPTAEDVLTLLGEHGSVVAWIAGHTHENVISPCRPGGACPVGGTAGPTVAHGFWRIETSSLVDYPQEGRIVEVLPVDGGGYALRTTMISPDPSDPVAQLSHELSKAEATCTTASVLGGPVSAGPYDQGRLEQILANAGEAAVHGNFCQGEASLALAAGDPWDRNTILLP